MVLQPTQLARRKLYVYNKQVFSSLVHCSVYLMFWHWRIAIQTKCT